jgi:hypothetical protein
MAAFLFSATNPQARLFLHQLHRRQGRWILLIFLNVCSCSLHITYRARTISAAAHSPLTRPRFRPVPESSPWHLAASRYCPRCLHPPAASHSMEDLPAGQHYPSSTPSGAQTDEMSSNQPWPTESSVNNPHDIHLVVIPSEGVRIVRPWEQGVKNPVPPIPVCDWRLTSLWSMHDGDQCSSSLRIITGPARCFPPPRF